MSDFQCKFYLLDGAETLECKDGKAEYDIKIADRPFPDSLLSFVYYDINSWEPRFHEAERSLREFYQTRDTKCLKPVPELLDDFQPTKISFEFVEEKQFTEVLYPQSMYDLIDFSLRECVQQRIAMRTCKNCGKYFALTVHGSTEYCSRVFDSRGRTCKEVGAMRQYMQSHAQDELLKIYRREYKRRFAWIRAGKISQEAFCAWSKDAQKEKEKCENGEIDQKEFTKWLKQ